MRRLDPALDAIVPREARIEKLADGFQFTEGPVWLRARDDAGQGALAVQCRAEDTAALDLLAALEDSASRQAVTAERQFLLSLGGGCSAPVAASARSSWPW